MWVERYKFSCSCRIEIPKILLYDEMKPFYFIGITDKEYQKIDFIKKENNITYSRHIGSSYVFVEEVKPNVLIKN